MDMLELADKTGLLEHALDLISKFLDGENPRIKKSVQAFFSASDLVSVLEDLLKSNPGNAKEAFREKCRTAYADFLNTYEYEEDGEICHFRDIAPSSSLYQEAENS